MNKSIKYIPKATKDQIYQVGKAGYKIYPVNVAGKFAVEYSYKGKTTRFQKLLSEFEVPEAIDKTIIHFYNKITDKNVCK